MEEEPNHLQFKFSIPEKLDHIPKTSVNQRDDINRRFPSILVIMALGSNGMPVTDFKMLN